MAAVYAMTSTPASVSRQGPVTSTSPTSTCHSPNITITASTSGAPSLDSISASAKPGLWCAKEEGYSNTRHCGLDGGKVFPDSAARPARSARNFDEAAPPPPVQGLASEAA